MLQTRVNQKLIAKRLKLSPATVSKSLRNHPDITPETRARVLQYAAKLGYEADLGVRGVRFASPNGAGVAAGAATPASTRLVGVLIYDTLGPNVRDYSGQGYVTGLSDAAARSNVSLVVHRFTGDSERILDPEFQPSAMRQGMLEGLILVHRYDPAVVRRLAERLSVITLTFYVPDARCDHIDSNHMGAMDKLLARLVLLGHRRVGYIARPGRPANALARFGSFVTAAARRGLQVEMADAINVFEPVDDFDRQAELAERRTRDAGVTAWMCSVDSVGYHLWKRLADRGLSVPGDVSITGFDTDEQMFGLPPLTSVRIPFVSMGQCALLRLLDRIERPAQPPQQIHFDCEVVDGQSVGPASARRP